MSNTKDTDKIKELKEMYANTSKHSNYQILPAALESFITDEDINVVTRNEKARLKYFLENVEISNKKVLDIGGNTGYFTFEFLKHGASILEYYEGNEEHAQFVKLAAEVLGYEDNLIAYNEYYNFDKEDHYDIILLLNVLHHLGDDFGDNQLSKEQVLELIIRHLKKVAKQTDVLIFQLGFNWKGNIDLPLFDNGIKQEMIDYILRNLRAEYEFIKIGVAEKAVNTVIYNDLNNKNIERDDSLGEFLNRPIFIMKSKKNASNK
ncbi:MAG: class I SAM-dependent methyltransferase [Bacteroidota bacterium]|nr:class I SAM-dependent methyltransferase [Bacteroidota bacterium]